MKIVINTIKFQNMPHRFTPQKESKHVFPRRQIEKVDNVDTNFLFQVRGQLSVQM